ncbi:MAG: 4-hydroxy-tetrahydrodipicolinate synthase [Bryobacteraceae bacterium]|nr:4-hydroxy-tetrahydrodipicolinate synthase [Bryobacteraceae bacterium]
MKFHGCGTALVTPFTEAGSLDESALRALVGRQIEGGIDFLVPCGTTGESPTLGLEEHLRVVRITIEEADGKVPVLAGAGGYNTADVIELAKKVEQLGADGILSVTPYYNKPTQEGLVQHYTAVSSAVRIPLIVYSVPGRTGVNVEAATIKRLSEIGNVTGIKEASGNIAQIGRICAESQDDFTVLSGDDALALAVLALGGQGLISVVSNVIPREMTDLVKAGLAGDFVRCRQIHRRWLLLMDAMFIESNPGPVKMAMAAMGLLKPVWRLPMVAPLPGSQKQLELILREGGLSV